MKICAATELDLDKLAKMNRQLIEDEGRRNKMSVLELRERMAVWLQHEYHAAMLYHGDEVVGYVLWRDDGGLIYIRQFFVDRELRRNGLGKEFFAKARQDLWHGKYIRLEVLVGNESGKKFWRAVGFKDYAITFELQNE